MKQVTILIALAGLATFAVAAPQRKIDHLFKLTSKPLQCEGTECPAGCCPEVGWFCCPDNLYCAATAADCPMKVFDDELIKFGAKDGKGTICGFGCFFAGLFCCPNFEDCVVDLAECP